MGRILEPLEARMLLKCDQAQKAAAEAAAKEIQKDIKQKVFNQAIEDYYNDYSPVRYKRKKKPDGLYRAFRVNAYTDNGCIKINGQWNFNWLPEYKSNSKRHKSGDNWISRNDDEKFKGNKGTNGTPEKGWIFENFMEGIHPKFYLDKTLDIVIDDSEQFEPSWLRIKQYKDEYFTGDAMRNILLKHLKRQYKKM